MFDIGGTQLTAEDRQILRHPKVGRLIIFVRNIEYPAQVHELCAAIRTIHSDLLLAIGREGGHVQRLRQGPARLSAMRAITDNLNAEKLAEHYGWLMTTEMQTIDLDLSFASVLDLDHQHSAVVNSRVFEGDPECIALFANTSIRGIHAAGVTTTGKHFPGHGWVEADSHATIPEDARSLEEIRRSDLVPLARLAGQLNALVSAHVVYPQVGPQSVDFSRRWLQKILYSELKFDRVIFSDDLSMTGAHAVGDAASRIETTLAVGCSMGLMCNVRISAGLVLVALRHLKVIPPSRLQHMCGKGYTGTDYRQQLRWLEALFMLHTARLIDWESRR